MTRGMDLSTGTGQGRRAILARAPAQLRIAPALAGVALLVVYARFGETVGFQAVYGRGFLHVGPGEIHFWLAHLCLATPGVLLLAWAFAPRFEPALLRVVARVDRTSPRAWVWAALGYFTFLFVLSLAGHRLVLLDMPFTDDENTAAFGARMIAEGALRVPALEPPGAFTDLFTYQRDGFVSAMDFPGPLLFGALAIVTGLGPALHALASAATGLAVAYAAGRWWGPRAAVLAALLWVASPMALSLSMTTHGHVPSRAFVALALAFVARLDTASGAVRRDAALAGTFAGLGLLCRPFEVVLLLLPFAVWLAARSVRGGSASSPPRVALLWMFAALLPWVGLFAWYNQQVTGLWYLQARFAPGVTSFTSWDAQSPWERLGFNLGFNVVMLSVWFMGVPATAAVAGAFCRARPVTIVLGAAVVCDLALTLAHDNVGVHSVGPIHYSECAVPLALLCTAGLLRGFEWLAAHHLARAPAGVLLAGYLVLGCGLFNVTNLASFHDQARIQRLPFDALASLPVHRALVLAPPPAVLVNTNPLLAPVGSWVFQYPPPDPFFRDDVIFARHTADVTALRARFPDRTIYRMTYTPAAESPIQIEPIAGPAMPGGPP